MWRSAVAFLGTILVLVALAVLPLLTGPFVHGALDVAGSARHLGVDAAVARALSDRSVSELIMGSGNFDFAGPDGRPLYDAAERSHLRDARVLLWLAFLAGAVSAGVVAMLVATAGPLRHRIWLAVSRAGGVTAGGVVLVGIVGIVAFDPLFTFFHQVLFPAGGWAFDPSTQRLVQLYPVAFWQVTAAAFGLLLLLLGMVTWWLGRTFAAATVVGQATDLGERLRLGSHMTHDELLSLDEARVRILRDVLPLLPQTVPLAEALGRVLASDAAALLTLPPWDNSAMDGFAVHSGDVKEATAATPVHLAVIGEVAAGHEPGVRVGPGTAVRILTGAIVPEGADAVVAIEETDAPAGVAERPNRVAVRVPVAPGAHIRRAGSDVVRGQPIVAAGTRLGPATLAALAATGHVRVSVHRRPRVAILATGDELAAVGEPLGPASIPDSNSESIAAQVLAVGAEPVRLGIAIDDVEAVRERMLEGVMSADVLVATGGVSVGARDVVKEVFEEIGTLDLWRVAVQPGKPLAYGNAARPDGGHCVLFGLPGNPVSSFVTFELFVRPVLRRLQGASPTAGRLLVRAVLEDPVRTDQQRRAFVRVRLSEATDDLGRYRAALAGGQGFHVLSALAAADGLAVVPEGVETLEAGAEVEVIRLDVEVS